MYQRSVLLLSLVVIMGLVGCGGGSSGSGSEMNTGMPEMPDQGSGDSSRLEAEAETDAILRAADSLVVSGLTGTYTDEQGVSTPVYVEPICTTTQCDFSALDFVVSLSNMQASTVDSQDTILPAFNGVSLAEGSAVKDDTSFRGFGGWLQQSYFASVHLDSQHGATRSEVIYGVSVGVASGTNPTMGNATWTGAMTGYDVSHTGQRGNKIQGKADLTFDLGTSQLDVALTRVQDLDAGTHHADMTWAGVHVRGGAFDQGSQNNAIKGRFYGSNHEEVGGTFERNQILGAFGAAR